MLRLLFCISCCNAPKSRPTTARRKSGPLVEKNQQEDGAPNNDLLTLNEKNLLLNNQIKSNFDTFNNNNDEQTQGRLLTNTPEQGESNHNIHDEELERDFDGVERMMIETKNQTALSTAQSLQRTNVEMNDYYSRELNFHGEQSASPLSSSDLDEYKEVPSEDEQVQQSSSANDAVRTGSQSATNTSASKPPSVYKNVLSQTKIGDYARLEYSPVEDLESVTTISQGQANSEKGTATRRSSAIESASQADHQKDSETAAELAAADEQRSLSRMSSHGIESTSISIASQLSHEQLQQNLTNMLESANSPSTFGTIGLPLGPPLDGMATETAKTSPETTGAALTSASQDSLSDGSLTSAPTSLAVTVGSASNTGAALVVNSVEQSYDEDVAQVNQVQQVGSRQKPAKVASGERVESPLSIETTTSGGLTNPTPTPSEMSGGSLSKKKSRLRPKSFLKKFRRSGKKSKSEEK